MLRRSLQIIWPDRQVCSDRQEPWAAGSGRWHRWSILSRLLAVATLFITGMSTAGRAAAAVPAGHSPSLGPGGRPVAILPAALPAARAPRFVQAAHCPWNLAAAGPFPADMSVKCGFVLVPEVHDHPGGPTLRLAVLVAQHRPTQSTDAIITLQGGPGGTSAVSYLTDFLGSGRDVIMFDQRGVGKSVPALNCLPVGNRDPVTAANDDQAMLVRCRDQLVRRGVDLNAYTIPEDAADVNDIRRALGYTQLDLYGLSYGTKLALAVMRMFPTAVRSVVLDSVLPAQTDVVAAIPANMQHALQQVFGACLADAWCRRTYPDLQGVFFQVIAALATHPAAIHARSGTLRLSGAQLVRLLYGLLVSYPQQVPAVIYSLKHQDYGPLTQVIDAEAMPSDATAWIMSWSIVCGDGNFGTHALVREGARSLWPQLRGIVAGTQAIVTLCESWPVKRAAAASSKPVTSAIPTLVLEGRLDAITPPAYGRLAAQTLTRSFSVEFPDRGHIVRGDPCSYEIITAFLSQPTARPASRCMATLAVNFASGASNGAGSGHGGAGQFTLQANTLYQAAAPVLHLTLRRLQELLASGRSLADVARLEHVDAHLVQVALLKAIRAQIDGAVRIGSLSRTEANRLYAKIKSGIDQIMNQRGGG